MTLGVRCTTNGTGINSLLVVLDKFEDGWTSLRI